VPKYIYSFAPGEAEGRADQKELLGGKGANLAEMCRLGLPVPAGFTLSTELCTYYNEHGGSYPDEVKTELSQALERLADAMDRKFADPADPLLVSVRSGARKSMPGMMETVLNVGLSSATLPGLVEKSGDERFVYDAYRRLITMYADVVMEKAAGIEPADGEGIRHQLEEILGEVKKREGHENDSDLQTAELQEICDRYRTKVEEVLGKPFPDDPQEQLWGAIGAVFKSWQGKRAVHYRRIEGIPEEWGTAVNVQAMVYGNVGEGSATGVAFTRHPATGENVFYGEWLPNAQGEDVVAGTRTPYAVNEASQGDMNRDLPTLETVMPKAYRELLEVRDKLEERYRDMQDVEFTVERGRLFMLQTRTGKRNGTAALRMAVEMADEGLIEKKTAITRVTPDQVDELMHPQIDPEAVAGAEPLVRGLPAGPGGAVGKIVLNAEDARRQADAGEKVILVRPETSPEDVDGMHAAEAIVTARGGMTSHAALVARGWGKTCVVGAGALEIDLGAGTVSASGKTLKAGDLITVDGTQGRVYAGELELLSVDPEKNEILARFLGWCDELRRLGIRANADRPEDAELARRFGAHGIGLCRTEHMFFGDERILPMRELILATDDEEAEAAAAKLLPYQREDFKGILKAMAGLPVIIRLLDPPLHEFVPHEDEQVRELADDVGKSVEEIEARIAQLHELNPMLGHRGCRLGVSHPMITRMQARAILEAAAELRSEGVDARPEIMVPLVGTKAELVDQKTLILEVAEAVKKEKGLDELHFQIGTMIEVPRAALTAGEIAPEAEFFSFGTNDLTQMTCGFSRDDVGTFMPLYVERGIYGRDPFATLDQTGVGRMVKIAVDEGRAARGDLEVGICGEHGGDPASIHFFHRTGLDYVSCSPFRVPIARLAAAQAAVAK